MKATRNFFEEIIQCLITRRDEWHTTYGMLTHKSGVVINIKDGDVSFEPYVELSYDEKKRLLAVVSNLTRLDVLEKIGYQDNAAHLGQEEWELTSRVKGFFQNVLFSIYNDPDNWKMDGSRFKHLTAPLEIYANKDSQGKPSSLAGKWAYPYPSSSQSEVEKTALIEAMNQWNRYQFLKKINEHLPKLEASAKTWGERCPYCLDKPVGETFRCECGVLVHRECALESANCPVCATKFQLEPLAVASLPAEESDDNLPTFKKWAIKTGNRIVGTLFKPPVVFITIPAMAAIPIALSKLA